MGLLDEVFPKKKEPSRPRHLKSTPIKKVNTEKSTRTTTEKPGSAHTSNNTFFDSLKRVQGALSPTSKTKSIPKQDVKRNRPISEPTSKSLANEKAKDRTKIKDKEKEKDKLKSKTPWFKSPSRSTLRKETIKTSTSSLNAETTGQKLNQDLKKKRPISAFAETNVNSRKGQNTKIEGDNLSRASSVTNLEADPKNAKGARPRKSSSRDRIDKIGSDGKKHDKKGIPKNNNKVESVDPYPSLDSLSEEELIHLRRQLQEMAQEKTNLALQLGEQKGQLNILQKEIQKLKEESNIKLEHLTEENTALRNRLRDVAHSPLSDNEKQQLLFDSHRHHSSAPASIATNIIDDNNGADTTCTTPDWDKHSSSNVSDVSVACLQDKINQMQETHYSTNEELQATLQELTDLQRQLTELQQENERLNEEKTLMFDSLCRQTERLNDARSEVESLKQLFYQEKDDTGQFETAVEREQKLVDLLKSAQEEREGLRVKLEQLSNDLQESSAGIIEKDEKIGHLRERVRTLECTLDAKHAEHKLLDQELAQAKDQCSGKQIEINRLRDLLENARTKINELEQDRTLSDKSELDELLDNARKEKDSLESEVAHLKEQLAISKNEIEKLKEQVSILKEECKVTRNNAKTTQSDLEYKCEKLIKDKNVLNEQLQEFQEALNELQVQSQCQLEDKRQLSTVLSETQRNLSEAERKNLTLESEVEELKRQRAEENEEWEKFQDDLLTSVRVANDFKTEAQQELQRMILENKTYRDRERQLKAEIEKLKGGSENMELLVKRPNKNKQRKQSGTLSTSSRVNTTQNLPVKRRENKSLKAKRLKTLSVEEEMLLSSLESYHADIDKTLPEEFLTEEQKVIRKLKIIYEGDFLKFKPVAPKPKDQLAISKPLLDSVLTNPKLMDILKNPNVKTIEDMASFEKEAPEIRNIIQDIDRSKKGRSENLSRTDLTKRISIIGRSMSCDHVDELEDTDRNLRLYRTYEAEDLTKEVPVHRESSLVPSDSASNYNRYSDYSCVVNRTENIKYSTLERIVKSIPKNTPQIALTGEQRFALKVLQALEERKNTLKKSEKAKTLPISTPTPESVLKNPKLKEIIYDLDMPDVRRKSEPLSHQVFPKALRESKSYENINVTFEEQRYSINVYKSSSESTSETFSSAEFNVETGETGPYEPIQGWKKLVDTPKIPRKDEWVTVVIPKTNRDNKKKSVPKAQLLKEELSAIAQNTSKEIHKTRAIIESTPKTNTTKTSKLSPANILRGYEFEKEQSLNKKGKLVLEGDYKIDLLQEKIKKIKRQSQSEASNLPVDVSIKTSDLPKVESNDEGDGFKHLKYELNTRVPDSLKNKDKDNGNQNSKEKLVTTSSIIEIKDKEDDGLQNVLHFTVINTLDSSQMDTLCSTEAETLETSETDKNDSLTYNETLTRIHKKETSDQNKQSSLRPASEEEGSSKDVLEQIQIFSDNDHPIEENILESSFVEVQSKELLGTLSLQNDNFPDNDHQLLQNKKNIEEPSFKVESKKVLEVLSLQNDNFTANDNVSLSFEETIHKSEDSPGYDYHAILKENRVGVTSPLNYRLSYKDVVKEIKKKFVENESEQEVKDDDSIQIRSRSDSIDKEMEDILENYLHARVSQLIKQTEDKPEVSKYTDFDKKLNDIVQNSFNQDRLDRIEPIKDMEVVKAKINIEEIDPLKKSKLFPKELTFSDDSYYELKEGSVKNIRGNKENITDITKKFIEDQKRVSFLDQPSIKVIQKLSTKTEEFLKEEFNSFKLEPKEIFSDKEIENVVCSTTSSNNFDTNILITSAETEITSIPIEKHPALSKTNLTRNESQIFTEEELEVVRRARNVKFPRPLSEFNENDLELVEALSKNYLEEPPELQKEEINNEIEDQPLTSMNKQENVSITIKIDESDILVKNNHEEETTKEQLLGIKENIQEVSDVGNVEKLPIEYLSGSKLPDEENKFDKENQVPMMASLSGIEVSNSLKEDIPEEKDPLRRKEEPLKLETSAICKDVILPEKQDVSIPSKIDKITASEVQNISEPTPKPKIAIAKADAPDDLEAFLNKASSSRSRLPKRRVHQKEENKIGTEIFEIPSEFDKSKIQDANYFETSETIDSNNKEEKVEKAGSGTRTVIDTNLPDVKTETAGLNVILYRNNKPPDRRNITSLTEFSNYNDDDLSKNRLSLDLSPKSDEIEMKKERKVKSFAQHFERLTQERTKYLQRKLTEMPPIDKLEKKPVPTPRLKNHGTKDFVKFDRKNEVLKKMSECEENFSAKEEDIGAAGTKVKTTEVPDLHESQHLVNDDFHSDSTDEDEVSSLEDGLIKKSDKFLVGQGQKGTDNFLESADTNDGARGSKSLIAVAGTAEKLDLRKHSNLTIEPSSLNLFNLDTLSIEENYIDQSKSDFNKKRGIGYMNATYFGEYSDAESFDDSPALADTKPKIVDFVPLDEATKPFFKNNHIPDYSTLDVVKSVKTVESREDVLSSETSRSSSRSSFSAAKKVFQDLEAKSEKAGVVKVTLTRKISKEMVDNQGVPNSEHIKMKLASKGSLQQVQSKNDEI